MGAALVPVAAGLVTWLNPVLRKSASAGDFIRIAPLEALPNDGVPRKFSVVADRVDAWNKYPNSPIGAVYLRRTADGKVEALNTTCPHAGGFVDYVGERNCFVCPLHNSQFNLDGAVKNPSSPSPRPMDSLAVEIRQGEVWVRYENYEAGVKQKIAV